MVHANRESTDGPPQNISTPRWTLDAGQLHVWQASFEDATAYAGRLADLLSDDEAARRERLRFERDRRHFAIGRGLLRVLLGRYTGLDPRGLCFHYGPYGKPALVTPGDAAIHFSVAHAGDVILYALAGDREVGIDVEHCRPMPDAESIVDRFFSPRERRAFHALPADERHDAFFRCWTRKEAYVKARGGGLSLPFDHFDVSLAPEEPPWLLEARGAAHDEQPWSLAHLVPAPGYVGAIAAPGRDWNLACWRWESTTAGNDILPELPGMS